MNSSLPPLTPLPKLKPIKPPTNKKIIRETPVAMAVDRQSKFSLTPSEEYIGGSKTQSQRAGLKGSYYFLYGDWTLYTEGFLEVDGAPAAKARRSKKTSALQELNLEYKYKEFLLRIGRQPVRWSEVWTAPSLDGWTARRYNRLFFDQLSEQLIHPTGTLVSWNTNKFSADFFHNVEPAVNIYPEPFPESKRIWKSEWGTHAKVRLNSGVDTEFVYFKKTDGNLYGAAFYYATDNFVPKLELGQDTNKNKFGIFALDSFVGKFSILPRVTIYSTSLTNGILDNRIDSAGTNFHLSVRWDSTSSWAEAQAFHDNTTDAKFLSARYGVRFGQGIEISCFVQKYEGNENTLFGLYEAMTGGIVLGTKIAIVL